MKRFAVIGLEQFGQKLAIALSNAGADGIAGGRARTQSQTGGRGLQKVGADEIIYPEIETAQRWAYKLIAPQIGEKIDFAPGYSLARIKSPSSFDDKTVMDLQLRQKYNINLVAIKRGEHSKSKKSEKG